MPTPPSDANQWNLTTIAAWWGAVVSTVALVTMLAQAFRQGRQRLSLTLEAKSTGVRTDGFVGQVRTSAWVFLLTVRITNRHDSLQAVVADVEWGSGFKGMKPTSMRDYTSMRSTKQFPVNIAPANSAHVDAELFDYDVQPIRWIRATDSFGRHHYLSDQALVRVKASIEAHRRSEGEPANHLADRGSLRSQR